MAKKKRQQTNAGALIAFVVLLAVLGVVAVHYGKLEIPVPHPAPSPGVSIPEPTKYKSLVVPITQVAIAKEDSARLGGFYSALAKKISEDGGRRLTTLGHIRAINAESGKLCFENTPTFNAYSSLSPLVDNVIGTAAGTQLNDKNRWDEIAINAGNSREIGDALMAVAWAVTQ